MCFSSKVKTPKVSSNIPAPEPVLEEEPKGIDYGADENKSTEGDEDGDNVAKVKREGESSDTPSALSTTKTTKTTAPTATSAIRRGLAKRK
ncbi:DUF5476 domain-containing protein [Pseudomonas oryzihabitans]|uniref:DUF5476 domain-containing protein n=1 Tax=Pseudomonas oryzihabitans TaxID=47885 RepID=UPI0015E2D51D|nr:DUF5476 domain-containing protein [Pseudomonas psychrotolerans]MBA1211539.1 DUF5476 domain-containing protein [Pseudomonas psychrotolerans]